MFDEVLQWFIEEFTNQLKNLIEWIYDLFVFVLNQLIEFIAFLGTALLALFPDLSGMNLSILPDSPTTQFVSTGAFGFARWVLPIDFAIQCVTFLALAFTAYFLIGPILRWLKGGQMTVELYQGTPGSGKSATAVVDMMYHIIAGGIVASNFKLVDNWALLLAKASSFRARRDSEYCLKLARKYWKRAFYIGDAETCMSLSRMMMPKKDEEGNVKKRGSESLERFCSYKMRNKKEGMGKLFIDEAQLYFNARSWRENMGYIEFLSQHRKLRWDVVVIAHAETMIDAQIRNFFEYVRMFRNMQKVKILGIPLSPVPLFWSIQKYGGVGPGSGNKTQPVPDMMFLQKKYANLYDSMDVFGLDGLSGRIQRQPARGLWPKTKDKKRSIVYTFGGREEARIAERVTGHT